MPPMLFITETLVLKCQIRIMDVHAMISGAEVLEASQGGTADGG
jgi:hypothetical protein